MGTGSVMYAVVHMGREAFRAHSARRAVSCALTGSGTFTVKAVINRNVKKYLEEWQAGHDPRATLVGLIDDPDAVDGQKERISVDNVWFNELTLMTFKKGEVVSKEFPFGFTPEDAEFIEDVE